MRVADARTTSAAELLVRCLEAEGVRRIFGVPGEQALQLELSLTDSPITLVVCAQPASGVAMAGAHARVMGDPGVCLAAGARAAAQLLPAVAQAHNDRTPLVVLVAEGDGDRGHRGHDLYVPRLFAPVSKWARRVAQADEIPELVRWACKLSALDRPGVCVLEIPAEVASAPARGEPLLPQRLRRPIADPEAIERAWQLLRVADKPVILAGRGAARPRVSKQLTLLCEATGLGVVTTVAANGAVGRSELAALGCAGAHTPEPVMRVLDTADLVLGVGLDLDELPPRGWNARRDKRIVHVDFAPSDVEEHYHPSVEVVGDIAHSLWLFNERANAAPVRFDVRDHRRAREELLSWLDEYAGDDTDGSVRPQKAVWDVRRVLGPEDILVAGVGAHADWLSRCFLGDQPGNLMLSGRLGAPGCALPAAIAVKLAQPDRRVLAVAGERGLLTSAAELQTAVRLGVAVVLMVWEDHGEQMVAKLDDPAGVGAGDGARPDILQLAAAFGWKAVRAGGSRMLQHQLEEAFLSEKPAIVAVPIDYRENRRLTARLGARLGPG